MIGFTVSCAALGALWRLLAARSRAQCVLPGMGLNAYIWSLLFLLTAALSSNDAFPLI